MTKLRMHISRNTIIALGMATCAITVIPVIDSFLIPHLLMMGAVMFWLLIRPLSGTKSVGLFVVILSIQTAGVYATVGFGERILGDTIKLILLVTFTMAMLSRQQLVEKTLYIYSILIGVFLIGYMFVSPDPFIYGGRLGIQLSADDQEKIISANTLGFAANIGIATCIARRGRARFLLLLMLLTVVFFTYSRGATLSFGFILVMYLWRKDAKIWAGLLIAATLVWLFTLDSNLAEQLRLDDVTGSGRTMLYQYLIENVLTYPQGMVFGYGAGSISYEVYSGHFLVSPHNGYIELLYSYGLFGLLMLGWIVRCLWVYFPRLTLTSNLYVVLIFIYAMTEDILGSHTLLMLGLMLSVVSSEIQSRRRCKMTPKKLAI